MIYTGLIDRSRYNFLSPVSTLQTYINKMFTDTKSRWSRIGFSYVYLKFAQVFVWVGLPVIIVMGIITILEYKSLAETQEHIALKSIIYQNIKHK